mgnify:CR=1 FL=1
MFGADENAVWDISTSPGGGTCGLVEQMASDEIMLRMTGDPLWAEHCEEVAFNSYPVAVMPDLKRCATSLARTMSSVIPRIIIRALTTADRFFR